MKFSINKFSEITGQDRRRIKRIAEAALTATIDGNSHLYESTELIPLLYDAAGYTQKLDLTQERALLAHYQARKAEIELKAMEGEYALLSDVVEEVSEAIANCKSRLLAIPSKAAPVVAGLATSEAHTLLEDYVREALLELHSQYATEEATD